MTHSELRSRTLERLGEEADGLGYFTAQDATDGLNWAQRLMALLTLCLETTQDFTLTAATCWHDVRATLSDWLLPLRVEYAGAKVRPARLSELDALNASWQAAAGDPERYACLGADPVLLAVYRQLAAGGTLSITYARVPAAIEINGSPEIPEEYQPLLIDAAVPYCRMKEGGQEMGKVQPLLRRFLDGAAKLGRYTRARSLDLRYDRLPPEIERFDLSRLLPDEPRRPTPWLTTSTSRPEAAPR